MSSTLPAIAGARLPDTYVRAKDALAACSRIDECKDWADKAEALASYAKQAKDDVMQHTAVRIQARAIRRCGELLRKIESKRGGNRGGGRPGPDGKPKGGRTPIGLTRSRAAEDAGLSDDQRKTAIRVASIPKREFERQVESATPPTVTSLAEQGTKPPPPRPEQFHPAFPAATRLGGELREFVEFCEATDPAFVTEALMAHELPGIQDRARKVIKWLTVLLEKVGERS